MSVCNFFYKKDEGFWNAVYAIIISAHRTRGWGSAARPIVDDQLRSEISSALTETEKMFENKYMYVH